MIDRSLKFKPNGRPTRTYNAWVSMRQRCYNPRNPDYPNYVGSGIKVCDRWYSVDNFFEDMGICPDGWTLERKDNSKDYEPGNCKWATWSEQRLNQRGQGSNRKPRQRCV